MFDIHLLQKVIAALLEAGPQDLLKSWKKPI